MQALKLRQSFEHTIERSEEELVRMADAEELPRFRPYWDPRLRCERDTRIRFFKRLAEIGLGAYRHGMHGTIGMFFLRKKASMQRMVTDAPGPNAMHRRSPSTELSTPGSLSGLSFSGNGPDGDGTADTPSYFASTVDLVDPFYQSEDEGLASWFGRHGRRTTPRGD